MIKFRTMRDVFEPDGTALEDAERLTPFGKKLRASSLDEIPELINVLKGEMSLIGPRPLLMEYLPLYSPTQARRHDMRPGLSGWAQVNGRNALNWDEKFALDIWYVDNQTLLLDLKIIIMTVLKIMNCGTGISAEGEATMPKFTGAKVTRLHVIGAGGHGKVVADTALVCGYDGLVFFDADWPGRKTHNGWPIVGVQAPAGPATFVPSVTTQRAP